MKRLYETIIRAHLEKDKQMVFIAGPRQVGKTTLAKMLMGVAQVSQYLNWDNIEHRTQILKDQKTIFQPLEYNFAQSELPIVVFDEINKFSKWKNLIKGMFDTYNDQYRIILTGSAKLNVYKKTGDSLMRRYFLYRIHPLSVGEIIHQKAPEDYFLREPQNVPFEIMQDLLTFGGFPDPYLKKDLLYYNRWNELKRQQFFKEDVREMWQVYNLSIMEVLYAMIKETASNLVSYASYAKKLQISNPTVKKWFNIFEELYYCFKIRPWHKNITRSLIKEPKYFLYDWSQVEDQGAKIKNMVASHLLKAVHFWTDTGLGSFDLFFLRDKDKREVDFLVTKNNKPWMLVEVKSHWKDQLNPNLAYYQQLTQAPHAFQVAYDMSEQSIDFRELKKPVIIPMNSFLSQLP